MIWMNDLTVRQPSSHPPNWWWTITWSVDVVASTAPSVLYTMEKRFQDQPILTASASALRASWHIVCEVVKSLLRPVPCSKRPPTFWSQSPIGIYCAKRQEGAKEDRHVLRGGDTASMMKREIESWERANGCWGSPQRRIACLLQCSGHRGVWCTQQPSAICTSVQPWNQHHLTFRWQRRCFLPLLVLSRVLGS